jgi:hypothetical protein
VSYQKLLAAHYEHLGSHIQGADLLCIQDTSEYNFSHHSGLFENQELGTISDGKSIGLRVHPTLVVDAADGFAYGFSSFQILNRAGLVQGKHTRKYNSQPIEEKESYRWLKSIEQSKLALSEARSITTVADRESDIYQLWSRTLSPSHHLVIRTSLSRKFTDQSGEGLTACSPLEALGHDSIFIPGRLGKADKGRQALVEISSQKAYTHKPKNLQKQKKATDADVIGLNIVSVKEVIEPGREIKEPLSWFLLTDLPVDGLEEAKKIVHIYKQRWHIEQIFRLTKQKGFAIEESQLESAHSLYNLIALVYIATVKVYQMVKCRSNELRNPSDVFGPEELHLLEKLKPSLEGKAQKSKNNNTPNTLAYYVWIIARLGNWKPEDRDPPGPITFKRGWETWNHYRLINNLITQT